MVRNLPSCFLPLTLHWRGQVSNPGLFDSEVEALTPNCSEDPVVSSFGDGGQEERKSWT